MTFLPIQIICSLIVILVTVQAIFFLSDLFIKLSNYINEKELKYKKKKYKKNNEIEVINPYKDNFYIEIIKPNNRSNPITHLTVKLYTSSWLRKNGEFAAQNNFYDVMYWIEESNKENGLWIKNSVMASFNGIDPYDIKIFTYIGLNPEIIISNIERIFISKGYKVYYRNHIPENIYLEN